jgi:2-keto-3-deoxy-L-fuconate dehydrogenase
MSATDDGSRPGLWGLRAVVTSGGSGIGLATVRLLASHGAVAAFDLEPRSASEPVEHLPEPLGIRADVTDDNSVQAAIEEVVARFGGLDILVNNVGVGRRGRSR